MTQSGDSVMDRSPFLLQIRQAASGSKNDMIFRAANEEPCSNIERDHEKDDDLDRIWLEGQVNVEPYRIQMV